MSRAKWLLEPLWNQENKKKNHEAKMAISRVVEDDEGMITRSDPDGYRGISYVIDTNMQTELVNLLQGGTIYQYKATH